MKKSCPKIAFSLIELSIVILVIGILVVGVTKGSAIIYQAKLKSARSLTSSSPVSSIEGLAYWLDSTSEASFDTVEQTNGSVITNWYDINPQSQTKNNFSGSGSSRPSYVKKCINDLPCVYFGGANYFGITNPNLSIVVPQITMFIVLKFDVMRLANYTSLIMTNGAWSSGSTHLQIVGDAIGFGTYTRVPSDIYPNTKTTYVANKTYLITAVDNSNTITIFANGANDMTTTQNITSVGSTRIYDVKIGGVFDGAQMVSDKYLIGRVGEIVVFNRGLKSNEIRAVTQYLGTKWGIVTS